MKQSAFYLKGLLVTVLTSLFVFLLLCAIKPFARNYQVYVAATIEKEKRADLLVGQRAFLVGGSNLALGVNSHRLSEAIGLKVANMGVHAGLGLKFMLNETSAKLRKGDIAILSVEYFLHDGDIKLQGQLVDVNPNTLEYFNYSILDKGKLTVQQLQRCLSESFYKILHTDRIDPIYRRSSFNAEGDLVAHYRKPKILALGDNSIFTDTTFSEGLSDINNFIDLAQNKGAHVYFFFPAYAQSAYKKNKYVLGVYSKRCKAGLRCKVFGSVGESVLPDDYFFDTVYHLDSAGIEKRTDLIINQLTRGEENILLRSVIGK